MRSQCVTFVNTKYTEKQQSKAVNERTAREMENQLQQHQHSSASASTVTPSQSSPHSVSHTVFPMNADMTHTCLSTVVRTLIDIMHSLAPYLNPTTTLKPNLNPQTALWRCVDQPKCPHNVKMTLKLWFLTKIGSHNYRKTNTHTRTHTHTQTAFSLWWTIDWIWGDVWGREYCSGHGE